MVNYFIGQSQADLETALAQAQDDLKAGKTIVQAHSGDTYAQEQVSIDIYSRIEQILHALSLLDPVTYPPAQVRRVARTRIRIYPFNDGLQQPLN
jgi:hypothetical protein